MNSGAPEQADYWKINSAVIRKHYPGLLEALTAETDDPDNENCIIENTASGLPTALINGLYVHSPRFPEREGKRLAQTFLEEFPLPAGVPPPARPVIVLGFGLGYAAEAAASAITGAVTEQQGQCRPIIIIEKRTGLLRKAFELRDLTRLLTIPGIVFIPGGTGEGVIAALALFEKSAESGGFANDGPDSQNRCVPAIMRNRTLTEIDTQWYAAVESRIRTWAMRDAVNRATLTKFGRRWVRNFSHNMNAIRDLPGITRLAGLAAATALPGDKPLPVFLAAAGPGLDSIGPLLPQIRQRCIVVAVDTSLRFLLTNGADPDFVLVVDPQFWNSRHLDRCPGPRTRLIAESAVYPPVLRLPFRGIYLCGSQYPLGMFIEQRVDPKGSLGAGGSVATSAWDFSRALGARQIWIAGLDLAFPGLKTHFRGAQFEEKALAESGRLNPAETWQVHALRDGSPFMAPSLSGGQVLTDRRLSLYAAWFENRFRRFPAIRNYSLCRRADGNSGLAIAGLEPVEPEALLALPERRAEIDHRLEAAFTHIETDFCDPEAARRRARHYENAVDTLRTGLEKIQKACEKGEAIVKQAMGKNLAAAEQNETLTALDKINRIIGGSEVKEIAGFLFPAGAIAELNVSNRDENGGGTFRSYLESSAYLYRSLGQACAEHKTVHSSSIFKSSFSYL